MMGFPAQEVSLTRISVPIALIMSVLAVVGAYEFNSLVAGQDDNTADIEALDRRVDGVDLVIVDMSSNIDKNTEAAKEIKEEQKRLADEQAKMNKTLIRIEEILKHRE